MLWLSTVYWCTKIYFRFVNFWNAHGIRLFNCFSHSKSINFPSPNKILPCTTETQNACKIATLKTRRDRELQLENIRITKHCNVGKSTRNLEEYQTWHKNQLHENLTKPLPMHLIVDVISFCFRFVFTNFIRSLTIRFHNEMIDICTQLDIRQHS